MIIPRQPINLTDSGSKMLDNVMNYYEARDGGQGHLLWAGSMCTSAVCSDLQGPANSPERQGDTQLKADFVIKEHEVIPSISDSFTY